MGALPSMAKFRCKVPSAEGGIGCGLAMAIMDRVEQVPRRGILWQDTVKAEMEIKKRRMNSWIREAGQ